MRHPMDLAISNDLLDQQATGLTVRPERRLRVD